MTHPRTPVPLAYALQQALAPLRFRLVNLRWENPYSVTAVVEDEASGGFWAMKAAASPTTQNREQLEGLLYDQLVGQAKASPDVGVGPQDPDGALLVQGTIASVRFGDVVYPLRAWPVPDANEHPGRAIGVLTWQHTDPEGAGYLVTTNITRFHSSPYGWSSNLGLLPLDPSTSREWQRWLPANSGWCWLS